MLIITNLLDDEKCYEEVRKLRWENGVHCPHCDSEKIVKRGFDSKDKFCQRYKCGSCSKQFDDLTGSIFANRHQPLSVWILCLYLMGLNLSNQQIAQELDLNKDVVQRMTTQLREGVNEKKTM